MKAILDSIIFHIIFWPRFDLSITCHSVNTAVQLGRIGNIRMRNLFSLSHLHTQKCLSHEKCMQKRRSCCQNVESSCAQAEMPSCPDNRREGQSRGIDVQRHPPPQTLLHSACHSEIPVPRPLSRKNKSGFAKISACYVLLKFFKFFFFYIFICFLRDLGFHRCKHYRNTS